MPYECHYVVDLRVELGLVLAFEGIIEQTNFQNLSKLKETSPK